MKSKIKTPFSIAWDDYKESKDYNGAVIVLKNKGMNQPYIDNIIYLIFSAGYNSK